MLQQGQCKIPDLFFVQILITKYPVRMNANFYEIKIHNLFGFKSGQILILGELTKISLIFRRPTT